MQATIQQLVEEVRRLPESLRSASPPASPKTVAKPLPTEHVEEGLRDNNGYGLRGLGKECAGGWKGEELGFRAHVDEARTTTTFRTEEIGLFDPHLPIEYGDGDIVSVGKTVYYRDVHLFVSQCQAIAKVRGSEVVRVNLHTCLRGTALAWYAAKSPLERAGLSSGLNEWIWELTARFKTSPSQAMDALLKEKYTVEDVRNGRDPMAYVQAVIQQGKLAELPLYNCVLFAWRNLDSTLQLHVPRPTIETSESQFIDTLLEKKEVWIRHFTRPSSPRGFRRYEPPNHGYPTNPRPYNAYPPHPYDQNRGYNPRQNDRPQPSQQPFRPRFANQPPREHEPRAHEPRAHENRARPQPAYHVNANPDDDVDAHPAAYYADQQNSEYLDQGPSQDETAEHGYANQAIARRTYPCQACEKTFPSAAHLDYHVTDAHYDYLASSYHTDAVAPIGYATVKASIGSLTVEPQPICLDTGATHTLIDRSLAAENLPQSSGTTLQIDGIAGEFTSSERVNLRLYIHSDNDKGKAYVVCKAHIVEGLDAGILVGMDVMQAEGMVLDCGNGKLIMNSHHGFTTSFTRSSKTKASDTK